jgi:hypothetical protein
MTYWNVTCCDRGIPRIHLASDIHHLDSTALRISFAFIQSLHNAAARLALKTRFY